MSEAAALILAGGGARRMGGVDKPLLQLAGLSMIEHIVAALNTPYIAISANKAPDRFAAFKLPVLADGDFAGQGPLAGVLAGLDWAAALRLDALLTVPGDTPFIPQGLADALDPPPACAMSGGRVHHLVALWPVARRDELRQLLSVPGRRDIAHFAGIIGMRTIDFAVSKWDPFLNINTPEDLVRARAIAEQQT